MIGSGSLAHEWQGYCIMGGLILATSCDLIVAADNARFSDRTVRWGGPHVQYSSLPWEIGVRKAKEYLFTGDWIDAIEAERIGLINRVVPADKLEEETMALARRLADGPPIAYRYMKENLNRAAMGADVTECLDLEATHHVHAGLSEDHRAAAEAFVNKQQPVFRGR